MCQQLSIPDEFVYHFALFLMQRKEDGDFVIVRKLQDFESPYISQKSSIGTLKLVIRKASWAPEIDEALFDHKSTLNLLYVQTIAEVERGWIQVSNETQSQLAQMQARGDKKEYMETASRLPLYGYLHFPTSVCDYPMSNTPAQIIVGNRELIMRVRTASGEVKEGSFKVRRHRCTGCLALGDNRSG